MPQFRFPHFLLALPPGPYAHLHAFSFSTMTLARTIVQNRPKKGIAISFDLLEDITDRSESFFIIKTTVCHICMRFLIIKHGPPIIGRGSRARNGAEP